MALTVVPLDVAAEKLARNAAAAVSDYVAAAVSAASNWYAATKASGQNYDTGVQLAIAEQRFQKGVSRSSPDIYAAGVTTKGSARFGEGVAAGAPKWAANFAPFHSTLSGLTLSPRRPRRDPANMKRVGEVVAAMIATAKARG